MKRSFALLTILSVCAIVSQASHVGVWKAPRPKDVRSPCPMLNSLANHGYLARNGLNISMADLITALDTTVNLASDAVQLVGALALATSTTGDSRTFNLDDLEKHGILEHDGSLSRRDVFFGDNHTFNSKVWKKVAALFTEPTISYPTAAAAHMLAFKNAAATNPTFNISAADLQHSYIESALYLSVFANGTTDSAVTNWVEYLFTEERLPYSKGWTRPAAQITTKAVLGIYAQLAALEAAST